MLLRWPPPFGFGPLAWVAIAYHMVSRLAFISYVAFGLKAEAESQFFTRARGAEAGFQRFRRVASLVMNNDGVSFVLLCIVTRYTMPFKHPDVVALAAGIPLILLGVFFKLWAAATVGRKAYYWHDFFAPPAGGRPRVAGPYRFVKNPMYTFGYLQTYGLAVLTGSLPGLAASVFDQALILTFYWWVERPHYERMYGK